MTAPPQKPSSKHPGHRETKIGADFYERQRVTSSCLFCGVVLATDVHPNEAAALSAEHRRTRHPDLATVKNRGRHVTLSTYQYQRRFQDEEELAFRDSRRFVNVVGRT